MAQDEAGYREGEGGGQEKEGGAVHEDWRHRRVHWHAYGERIKIFHPFQKKHFQSVACRHAHER